MKNNLLIKLSGFLNLVPMIYGILVYYLILVCIKIAVSTLLHTNYAVEHFAYIISCTEPFKVYRISLILKAWMNLEAFRLSKISWGQCHIIMHTFPPSPSFFGDRGGENSCFHIKHSRFPEKTSG